jgi:hypothetical protein
MVHSARKIALVLRHLLTGSALVATTATAGMALVACTDEEAPETHVKRLDDPAHAPAAVKRLIQFFEDAMTRDNKDRSGPTVKPLLDAIVEPMATPSTSGRSRRS